jgi:hypothetical protein
LPARNQQETNILSRFVAFGWRKVRPPRCAPGGKIRDFGRAFVAAKNIHRAREIRDAANNMPAMHAIKYIDGEAFGDLAKRSSDTGLGITINIIPAPPVAPPEPPTIDVTPTSAQSTEPAPAIDRDPIFKLP